MKLVEERVFMNTSVRIQVNSTKGTVITHEKIEQAFEKFAYVVKHFSRFDPESELSKLNNQSGNPVKVSRELFDLISYSLKLAKLTKGRFDPTIIDILKTYGWDGQGELASQDSGLFHELKQLLATRPKYSEVKLDRKNSTIYLGKNQGIDLGAIGKGYAIDKAYDALFDLENFLINAGGDIRVKGVNKDNKPWEIALYKSQLPNKHINREHSFGKISLDNCAIACSGGWERKYGIFHHLINTKTAFPENEISQTFAIADTAMEADAWATVLFLASKSFKDLKEIKSPQNIEYMIIGCDGNIVRSTNFPKINPKIKNMPANMQTPHLN